MVPLPVIVIDNRKTRLPCNLHGRVPDIHEVAGHNRCGGQRVSPSRCCCEPEPDSVESDIAREPNLWVTQIIHHLGTITGFCQVVPQPVFTAASGGSPYHRHNHTPHKCRDHMPHHACNGTAQELQTSV